MSSYTLASHFSPLTSCCGVTLRNGVVWIAELCTETRLFGNLQESSDTKSRKYARAVYGDDSASRFQMKTSEVFGLCQKFTATHIMEHNTQTMSVKALKPAGPDVRKWEQAGGEFLKQ
ncbi:Protein of unknown function [Gryllus bimaculatus]|nr:Protein of unknown function [Gryllus bimaculatus]